MDVTDLFRAGQLFVDRDGDGYPDDLNLQLQVDPGLADPCVWIGIVNLAARLAFQVVALARPVVTGTGSRSWSGPIFTILKPGKALPGQSGETDAQAHLQRESDRQAWLGGSSGFLMMRELNRLATGEISDRPWQGAVAVMKRVLKREHGAGARPAPAAETVPDTVPLDLLRLGGAGGFYQAAADQPGSRSLRLVLQLGPEPLSFQVGRALANGIAWLALDATEIVLPLARVAEDERVNSAKVILQVRESGGRQSRLELLPEEPGRPRIVRAVGSGRALAQLLERWLETFRHQHGRTAEPADLLRDQAAAFRDLVNGTGFLGRWAHHLAHGWTPDENSTCGMAQSTHRLVQKACRALNLSDPAAPRRSRSLRRTRYWAGEVAEIIRTVSDLPVSSGTVRGLVWVSKPGKLRGQLKIRLEQVLRDKGVEPAITVLNAYKPGLCWLLEVVLPRLRELETFHRIEIRYQPFRDREGALEMRSRWLQELFPGPEILARELGLACHKIEFREDRGQSSVYRILAVATDERRVLDLSLIPPTTRIPYLVQFPDQGFVHPTTGGIQLETDDGRRWEIPIATDRLRFWEIFQQDWLPDLLEEMANRLKQESCPGETAFWEQLRVTVAIDETDRELGFENERLAPMEALHEDLYFALLDAFAAFSKALGLPDTVQLGQVVPVVLTAASESGPGATFRARPLTWPALPEQAAAAVPQAELTEIGWQQGSWQLGFSPEKAEFDPEIAERTVAIARAWDYAAAWDGARFHLRCQHPRKRAAKGTFPAAAPPRDRLLSAQEVDQWIQNLGTMDSVEVWQPARSFRGRPVSAMELTSKRPNAVYSAAKLRLLKPTLLVNARHHANEVSSTQAALDLAWHLATTSEGGDLLKQLNVVMIPLENRDGVALFEDLLPQCPGHMLHAARYNALGSEYYGDYHRDRPRFPEARAKRRLWDRWLPEFMVDHHGVPQHEWNQPFSGYAPHRFREFWIPRTFIYVYVPFVEDDDHRHAASARELAAKLADRMATAEQICSQNRRIAHLYQRYAKGVEPDQFPPSAGEPLLVLPFVPRVYRHNFAFLYPHITRTDIVVEVPDEVADGRQLALCIQAHRLIQETLMEQLRNRPHRSVQRTFGGPGSYRYCWH